MPFQSRRTSHRKATPATRLPPDRAVEAVRVVGRAWRGERHHAALVRDRDGEVRATPVGERGRSLDGVAGALLAGQGQLHLAILPRGRQARFAARLGHGEELFRRNVLQLLHSTGRPLYPHEVRIRRVAETAREQRTSRESVSIKSKAGFGEHTVSSTKPAVPSPEEESLRHGEVQLNVPAVAIV